MRWFWALVAIGSLIGCGGGGGGGSSPAITALVVSIPDNSTVATGVVLHLTAVAVYNTGDRVDVTPSWATAGSIGTLDVNGVYTASGAPGAGTITATYQGVPAVVNVSVVSVGALSQFQVEAPKTLDTTKIPLSARPYFYLSALSGGNRVIVPADNGSWQANPAALGTLDAEGRFTPQTDSGGLIQATGGGGTAATPKSVSIVAPKVTVRGAVKDISALTGVAGTVVVFWNALGDEVGRATTKGDGTWTASISSTAKFVYLESVPAGYFADWKYGSLILDINFGPDACKAPIPPPAQGLDIGVFYLYSTSGGPPPPPNC